MKHAYNYMDRPAALVMADAAITAYVSEAGRCLQTISRCKHKCMADVEFLYNHLAVTAKHRALAAAKLIYDYQLIGSADYLECWVQLESCLRGWTC